MKNTRVLTEGALMAALFTLILILSVFVPFIGLITLFLLPFPIIIYVLRHGIKPGLLLLTVVLSVSFFVGGLEGLPLAWFVGVGGLVVGELYRRKKSGFAVLLGGSLAYIVNFLLLFIGSIILLGINPIEVSQQIMRESVDTAEQLLISFGQESSEQLEQFESMIELLGKMTAMLIIFTGVMYALISQLIANVFLTRLGFQSSKLPPIREWSFPKSFLWYYLIVSILMIMGMGNDSSALSLVLLNLFPLLEVIMAIQGFAVIFYWSYQKKVTIVVPIMAVVFGLILPIFLYIVRILGIIDLGFDLRKKLSNDKKQS
ncbi:MAG TPA: DUF2232 domain-containing protein [Bacilli bacterium]|nr:DUF2232 domain-containing protein [Bacilli bacterium]